MVDVEFVMFIVEINCFEIVFGSGKFYDRNVLISVL